MILTCKTFLKGLKKGKLSRPARLFLAYIAAAIRVDRAGLQVSSVGDSNRAELGENWSRATHWRDIEASH